MNRIILALSLVLMGSVGMAEITSLKKAAELPSQKLPEESGELSMSVVLRPSSEKEHAANSKAESSEDLAVVHNTDSANKSTNKSANETASADKAETPYKTETLSKSASAAVNQTVSGADSALVAQSEETPVFKPVEKKTRVKSASNKTLKNNIHRHYAAAIQSKSTPHKLDLKETKKKSNMASKNKSNPSAKSLAKNKNRFEAKRLASTKAKTKKHTGKKEKIAKNTSSKSVKGFKTAGSKAGNKAGSKVSNKTSNKGRAIASVEPVRRSESTHRAEPTRRQLQAQLNAKLARDLGLATELPIKITRSPDADD